jgi:hypothetical protein
MKLLNLMMKLWTTSAAAAIATAAVCLMSGYLQAQDHGHLNGGAESPSQGSKLVFANGADFSSETGYVKTLSLSSAGKYAGYFEGNITLTALHATDAFGDPVPFGPAPGAFLAAEIVSVQGPSGGAFQFWDADSTTAPTYNIPAGTHPSGAEFDLSEEALGAGSPGGDPFGHIHGRRFTVTKPGLYTVQFRLHDRSVNGQNGGAIHETSEPLSVQFQGGYNVIGIQFENAMAKVTFGAAAGFAWQLESKDDLKQAGWDEVGEPLSGEDKVVEVADDRPLAAGRFYRLQGTPLEP